MAIFFLTLAGFLFSGYLSLVKLLSNTCALNESCPYFLNYPTCWYGFGLFSILLTSAIFNLLNKKHIPVISWIQIIVSGVGIVFASYFTWPEIIQLFEDISLYQLGLPSCAYGLIFYTLIFTLAVKNLKSVATQKI